MKLSAPLYRLKREAKLLARADNIPMHQALDRIAESEGFHSWSLLSAKYAAQSPASRLFKQLQPGELLLLAARPGQGKTTLSMELLALAIQAGRQSAFFTLEYTRREALRLFDSVGGQSNDQSDFIFDNSDHICAAHVVDRLDCRR